MAGAFEAATAAARTVATALREAGADRHQRALARLGALKELTEADRDALGTERQRVAAADYQRALSVLCDALGRFDRAHAGALGASREKVKQVFQADPDLRQVLMLSNEAHFPRFDAWLDKDGDTGDRGGRRMADLLAMYLQRVTTKNETTSHFGPVSVGRGGGGRGMSWTEAPLERVAYFSHWAAERLALVLGEDPVLRAGVRPRRLPLAFRDGERVDRYAFRTVTGMPGDWKFVVVGSSVLDADQCWVWRHADGDRTLGDLARIWQDTTGRPAGELDEVVRRSASDGWLIDTLEIPIGEIEPLSVLRRFVAEAGACDTPAGRLVDRLEGFLTDFPAADPQARRKLAAEARREFDEFIGETVERAGGSHYADRSIFYEEAFGPQRDLAIGGDLRQFIEQDLSIVYDMVLLAPRARMRGEARLLHDWAARTFGPSARVPLHLFYQRFFADEQLIHAACAEVDRHIAAIEAELRAVLLGGTDLAAHEGEVDRELLEAALARHAGGPPALCSPDVMFAARDARALAEGAFTAVVGDCHALRDPLTHSSLAPLLATAYPGVVDEAQQRYDALLDPDEVLVDLARAHLDKTGAQLTYPCLDVEVYGRSGKSRDRVIQPADLYIVVGAERLELRAAGVAGRLRLKSPFAGGPGIRHDPLSVFAFPRHFGGIGIRIDDLPHVPRLRCGRVVLRRESWRTPVTRWRPWSPVGNALSGDAAAYLGAERLRRDLGLPDQCFVKIPGEPKPVYIDWRSPLLVRQLLRLAKGATGTLEFSEVLPGADDLWLEVAGARHTSELRCTVFSRGAQPPAAP